MDNVVLTPHIGGATYDTEANHSALIADGLVDVARRRQARQPREPGGARCSSKALTAAETKEQLLWVAKEMLRTNLVQGTAGNLGGGCPTATPS